MSRTSAFTYHSSKASVRSRDYGMPDGLVVDDRNVIAVGRVMRWFNHP